MSNKIKPPKKKPHLVKAPGPTLRERMAALKEQTILRGLREHPLLGRGTNSVIQECFTDEELLEELAREKITTLTQAIKHFAIWDGLDVDDLIEADQDNAEEYLSSDEDDDDDEMPAWWREWDDYDTRPDY